MRDLLTTALWTSSWRKRWQQLTAGCGSMPCSGPKSLWRRMWRRHQGVLLEGVLYCHPPCLEAALRRYLVRLESLSSTSPPPNRMPLGLLMVARGKLTYEQVLAALSAQQRARSGKIGEWIEKLGFATEREVTAALGLQWGCPVASSLEADPRDRSVGLPLALLEAFFMLPLHHAPATNTLYIAFGERVDHRALYAIEQMLDCRTQPCVAGRKQVADRIERMRQQPRPSEVEFGPLRDDAEMARIAMSYIAKLAPEEVRLSRLGLFIWLRLNARSTSVNVLFRLRGGAQLPLTPRRRLLPVSAEYVKENGSPNAQEHGFSASRR
jgi:hypothetical protein